MRIGQAMTILGLSGGLLLTVSAFDGGAALAKPPTGSARSARLITASSTSQNSGGSGSQQQQQAVAAPQMWVHGISQSPQLGVPLHAVGGRYIVDQRKIPSAESAIQLIEKYNAVHMGLALTLRWADPNDHSASVKYDTPPNAQESAAALSIISQAMSSPAARQMGDKLWIQFYAEVGGGVGTMREEDVPAFYDYATQAAAIVREKAPQANVCGPAIWGQAVLLKSNVTGQDLIRRNLMLDAINWTVQNHAAIDVHLYMASGDDTRTALTIVRQALANAGGADTKMVAMEWAPAKYPDQSDLDGARNVMIDMYRVMAEFQMPLVSYGCYWVPENQPDIFKWDCLMDAQGQRHEPFYSTFGDLADGTIGLDGPVPPEGNQAVVEASSSASSSRIIRKRAKKPRAR